MGKEICPLTNITIAESQSVAEREITMTPQTKTKHSPAPWVATKDKHGRNYIWKKGDELEGSNRLSIAATHYNHEANARLIASAPCLLEALKGMVETWNGPRDQAALKFAHWVNKANLAISKAEGES